MQGGAEGRPKRLLDANAGWFFLAEKLGVADIYGLQSSIPDRVFQAWMVFFGLAKPVEQSDDGLTEEQLNRAMKAALIARMGGNVVHKTITRSELERSRSRGTNHPTNG